MSLLRALGERNRGEFEKLQTSDPLKDLPPQADATEQSEPCSDHDLHRHSLIPPDITLHSTIVFYHSRRMDIISV